MKPEDAARRIRVAVSGAAGRMGRAAIRSVAHETDMVVVAALGRTRGVGRDAGEIAGAALLGVTVSSDLSTVLAAEPDVWVEFAPGAPAAAHARVALERGIRPVVGSTGISLDDIERLRSLAASRRVGAVVAPNFAIGAVLMMEFARLAARFLPHVEVIELHHDRKRDAPSGTAQKTAQLIAETRGDPPAPAVVEEEMVPGARGGLAAGVRVHSVRLPGLGAHQEVIFGGPGQTLTIRHDSLSEESFMPGLLLAIRRSSEFEGLAYGLEHLLGLR
jgi:4-hydroxy-tetrahydrodipicolinate reductase